MQYRKNLWLTAIIALLGLAVATGCGDNAGKTTAANEDVRASTLWKTYEKAAFDNGTVTEVVVSGTNTYVATSDKGLFVSINGADFVKVDLSKGTAPGSAAPALPEAGVNIKHVTALSGNRVIFSVVGGTNSVIVAEGNVAKRSWVAAPGVPANVTAFVVATGGAAPEKEHIFAVNNVAATIFMQLDSADANLAAWNISLTAAGAAPFPANSLRQLALNHDGSALVFSKEGASGYDTIPKANWNNAGAATSGTNVISLFGAPAAATVAWVNNAIPANIVFTGAERAVFNVAAVVGFATKLTNPNPVNTKVTLSVAPTAINKLKKDTTNNVNVLTNVGIFKIDGTSGTEIPGSIFIGEFTGDNYVDQGKSAADLAAIKAADLPKFTTFGSKDIKDMAASANGTYYIANGKVFKGTQTTLKLAK